MLIYETIKDLSACVESLKQEGKTIGLLPTMGALHDGHLSLLRRAKEDNDVVICSIFVNPVQFNNEEDLKKYPRDIEADIALLEANECDIVFIPSEDEIYPEPPTEKYNFGELEQVMEGVARPGHFNGVAIIVRRLFDWTKADNAYFGEKDFQQVAIIKDLVRQYSIPVKIVVCPIYRDADGLASSSRNKRLSPEKRALAPKIHQILLNSASCVADLSLSQIKGFVMSDFKMYKDFKVEYFEIVDDVTLQPVMQKGANGVVGCIAVWLDGVRLIDMQRYY
ncbi:MAG: pantoate--beta-alanine ligase [Bacteroidales bacterium]|jgi:pantoate--beta-alanine ligase|nr:pantoate--beta-alanine ligase [Bacteroidales bacterium]